MRKTGIAFGMGLIVACALAQPSFAAKTKMGCERGTEIWNAAEGKCVPGTPKKMTAGKKAPAKAKTKKKET